MMVRSLRYFQGRNCTGANHVSHTPKSTRPTTPKTIMQIMLALCHPLPVLTARLNGSRSSAQPAVISRMPMTIDGRSS